MQRNLNMKPHTIQHDLKFKLHGHTVTMKILAYRKLYQDEIDFCVEGYIKSLKKKKLKEDVEVALPTTLGIEDSL